MSGARHAHRARRSALGGWLVLGTSLVLAAGCHGSDVIEGGAHEPVTKIDVVDERTEMSRSRNVDPFVVGPLMTPKTEGRIIYDPPTSLARVAASDSLVRRENTALTGPEGRGGAARDSASRGGNAATGTGRQSGAARDTSGRP